MSHRGVRGESAPAWLAVVTCGAALVAGSGALAIAAPWLAPAAVPARALAVAAPAPAPAPAPIVVEVPTPVAPAPAACAPVVSLRFAYGAALPPVEAAAELAPILTYLRDHADATALVDGHADATGDDLGNLVLSKRRATRVADVLVAAGIARPRVVVRAFGAYVPAPGEPSSSQRRVRVTALDPRCPQEDRP